MRISDWSSDVCSSDLWSKAEAEKVVEASALDWVMVRPPAIYGPGDMEMRDLFRLARWGIALLLPPVKLSVNAVSDLARLLLALVDGRSNRRLRAAEDGQPGGRTHVQFDNDTRPALGPRG